MFWLWYGPAWRRPPHGIRTTIGTEPPQRYRIFAALLTSWLKPVATKSLNCISPIGRCPRAPRRRRRRAPQPFGERRVDDAVAEFLEQRPQQQERVAVLAADVLAVDEDARVGAQRVADAQHDGIEERVSLRVEGGPRLERRQGSGLLAPPHGSRGSTRRREGSPAMTFWPATSGSGHGASMTRRASALDERFHLRLPPFEVARADDAFCLETRGIGRDRVAPRPEFVERAVRVALLEELRVAPGGLRLASEIEHVVVVGVAAHAHADELDQRRPAARARPLGRPGERRGDRLGVRAVDRDAGHAVARGLLGEDAHGRLIRDGRRERRLVVLDAEDRREPAGGAEVDRLVPLAERRPAFADEGDRHAARLSRAKAIAMPAAVSAEIPSGAAGGRMPQERSPTWRSLPSMGGPALPICAERTMRTVSASGRIASAAPRSRMSGATTSPCQEPSRPRYFSPRRSRIAAA